MRKREQDKFKKLLILERQNIVRHLSELEGSSKKELSQSGGDSVDIAAMEITQTAIQKLGNREKKLLVKIDSTMLKFEAGEYGVCEECGENISAKRLEARLVAQFCIDCKTEFESNERRYSDAKDDDDDWDVEQVDETS